MRGAFDRALALSTNLMFGSNNGEWRMRYAAGGRKIVEWRDPSIDPVADRRLDNGFFAATYGEPECALMAVEHQWAAQRSLAEPPHSFTVVEPGNAAGWRLPVGRPGIRSCGGRRLRDGTRSFLAASRAEVVRFLMTALLQNRYPTVFRAAQTWSGRPRRAAAACSRWARWNWRGRSVTWRGAPANPHAGAYHRRGPARSDSSCTAGQVDNPAPREEVDHLGAPECPRPAHRPGGGAPGGGRPRVRG